MKNYLRQTELPQSKKKGNYQCFMFINFVHKILQLKYALKIINFVWPETLLKVCLDRSC